jgi:sodium-dependent phosphate transporter
MIFGTIFEMLGAITVGARTADTIKNGIIPSTAFRDNAGVQMLAFTCALAAASSWVMWCTRHSAHVSSTYSLISAVAGVGVATVGVKQVQWGWNDGKGLGAIFAGLGMAPAISAGFAATIFMLIKLVVHLRKNPQPWAVYTSPFFFLIAGTICTLSIVYKGSPELGLSKKPASYIAAVTMGTGGGVALLSAIFFVPFVHAKVIKKDYTVKWYMFVMGPLLFRREAPADAQQINAIPNYAVVQDDEDTQSSASTRSPESIGDFEAQKGESADLPVAAPSEVTEKNLVVAEASQATYKELVAQGEARLHAKLLKKRGPLGWAMRTLRDNPTGAGRPYELNNMIIIAKRIPAMIVVGALYGLHYDIHAAQSGIEGTPEGDRMKRVYDHATKYPNDVEHTYSFVQILTACTASFAHGANDVGNSVAPWAVIYSAWSTGTATSAKASVPIWQLAVLSLTISIGFITYGYNIMKGKPLSQFPALMHFLLTRFLQQLWVTRSRTTPQAEVALWRWVPPSPSSSSPSSPFPSPPPCASLVLPSVSVSATVPSRPSTGNELASLSSHGSSPSQLRVLLEVCLWALFSTPLTSLKLSLGSNWKATPT